MTAEASAALDMFAPHLRRARAELERTRSRMKKVQYYMSTDYAAHRDNLSGDGAADEMLTLRARETKLQDIIAGFVLGDPADAKSHGGGK